MRKRFFKKKKCIFINKTNALNIFILIAIVVFSCSKKEKVNELKNQELSHPTFEKEHRQAILTSEQIIDAFISGLKQEDFSKSYSLVDDDIKKKVSQEQLRTFWKNELISFGKYLSFVSLYQSSQQGKDLYIVMLKFEKGESWVRFTVDAKLQKMIGVFFGKSFLRNETPASYVSVQKFREEEVSFGKKPFILKGTLTIPTGSGPFPAVVLVHGSGPNDRDETAGRNKIFKDIAEGLASQGIAVLRYDKRTWISIYPMTEVTTIDGETIDDAIEAILFLQGKMFVNPQKIGVIGHSLGALLAPEIAVRATAKIPIAGIILLAPPARAPWDAVLQQLRFLGVPSEKLASIEKEAVPLREGTKKEGKFWGLSYDYWRDWASRDGISMVKKLAKPTLILRGDRDYQVIDEDMKLWQQGLNGVAQVEMITLPHLNHLFIAGTGKPGPAEYEIPGHVDAIVIDKLSGFIHKISAALK